MRRKTISMARTGVAAAALMAALAAGGAAAEPKRAPLIVFAQEGTALTLDPHFSNAVSTRNIAMHIFETLITRGEKNAIIDELAESHEASPDGLAYSFKI